MDEPLPLPYLDRTSVRHEKHTESVKREGESGGSGSSGIRRKIEVGEPLPLGYNGKGKGKGKGKERVRVKLDLGEPLPLDNSVSEESFEDKEKSNVGFDEERGKPVKQKSKVLYDFGPPLPLDYGTRVRRGNVTSHLSDEEGSEVEIVTSSPVESCTVEETVDMVSLTEEVLRIAGQNEGDPVQEIKGLIEDGKRGGEYRLAVLRAQRIARRQVGVFEEVLKTEIGRRSGRLIGVGVGVGVSAGVGFGVGVVVLVLTVLASVSYVLAD
ncbi:hypothetical protein CANINC_000426 [Pichia inconspicua]|uniref:Uncharacterized protein n=1 Tax=Pichia inconspicua TaxID=52247 RepID=A0A4V4NG81_9ASCO|nr:hypothetical protein CANINC_000426 [[Candida] inconspicua]